MRLMRLPTPHTPHPTSHSARLARLARLAPSLNRLASAHWLPQVMAHTKILEEAREEHFSAAEVTARTIKDTIKYHMMNTNSFFASLDKDASGGLIS